MELLLRVQIGGIFVHSVDEIDLRDLHFLVILFLTYFVTRKVFTFSPDALSGIIARWESLCCIAPLPHL